MQTINIKKTLNFTNGGISVRFDGRLKDDNKLDNIKLLLENFVNDHRHRNMVENISILRTIFKECEEELLVFFYRDENGSELVKYDKSNLVLFEKIKNGKNDKNLDRYKFTYEFINGINLNYSNFKNGFNDYLGIKMVSEEITCMMNQLHSLQNVKALSLNQEDKALIEIYKLFFNENPNFSNSITSKKVQAMMSILAEFNISLGEQYCFGFCVNSKMPVCTHLMILTNKLYPLGEVDQVEDPVILKEEVVTKVKLIGECIKKVISEIEDQVEALMTISSIIYAGRYNLESANAKEISEFIKIPESEVNNGIRLVRRIKNIVNQ